MAFNADHLSALLEQLEKADPPKPTPAGIVEFTRENAQRLRQLVDRGWPLDILLQRLLDDCSDDKKPALRTLRTHYKKATCAQPGGTKKRGRPRGGNKNAQVTAKPSPVRESLREFLK